ncbi:MAG: hypothetical protein ABWZ40_06970, partial [Caulobacterales bacterium]
LALEPDAPLFLFSEKALIARTKRYLKHFPGDVSYAVKCNPTEPVLKALGALDVKTFDVASIQEIELVSAAVPGATLHYHNPVKSRREIDKANKQFGCRRFAVDCVEEIDKLHAVIGGDPEVELAVRFVLPRDRSWSSHDFSTKFGAPEHECAGLLQHAQSLGYKVLLTFHPGSQVHDTSVYVRHIEAAARIAEAAQIKITRLNVGGGFPANYLLQTAPEPEAFFTAIDESVKKTFDGAAPKLECEPGRGLVADCMSLLTRVKLVAAEDVFLNDGVYGGLLEFLQMPELRPPTRVWRGGKRLISPSKSYKVFGPTCDPIDELPHRIDLPEDLRDEDYVEFGQAGAYGYACMTNFNGYGGHRIIAVDEVLSL